MSREVHLQTTVDDIDRLHELANGRMQPTTTDRDRLAKLLVDHTALVNALRSASIKAIEPAVAIPKRQRAKLTAS